MNMILGRAIAGTAIASKPAAAAADPIFAAIEEYRAAGHMRRRRLSMRRGRRW
jgi:hypothetical protein